MGESRHPVAEDAPDPSPQAVFASLRVRNFRLFFVGQFVSQSGTWLTLVAQILLVLDLTDSGIWLGMLTASRFGPTLLLGAWTGTLADRLDKRRILLVVQLLAMTQSLALAGIVLADAATLPLVLALTTAQGVLTAFDNPARRSFVSEMVPDQLVPNAVSLNTSIMNGSRVIGPLIAGLLVTTAGYWLCFVVDGLSYVAAVAALAMMRPAELYRSTPVARGAGQVRQGIRYIRGHPVIWTAIVATMLVGALAFTFEVTVALLVRDTMGGSELLYTSIYASLSVGSVGASLLLARHSRGDLPRLLKASVGFGVALAALAVAPTTGLAFAAAVGVGAGSAWFAVLATTIVQVAAAPEMRGRALVIQAMVWMGSAPIGGVLAGWVGERFGARSALLVGAAGCLSAAAWVLRRMQLPDPAAGTTGRDCAGGSAM